MFLKRISYCQKSHNYLRNLPYQIRKNSSIVNDWTHVQKDVTIANPDINSKVESFKEVIKDYHLNPSNYDEDKLKSLAKEYNIKESSSFTKLISNFNDDYRESVMKTRRYELINFTIKDFLKIKNY